eukprot:8522143-Pyramimonas_sp.AAC.1
MSHWTCWLDRVERRSVWMVWYAGGSNLRYPLQLLTTVEVKLIMSCGMLAARRARVISSLVAYHHRRCSWRGSRKRVLCESRRCDRKEKAEPSPV